MPAEQTQDLCVHENESMTILLEVFDEQDELLDLTGVRILMVAWNDAGTLFTKDTAVGITEVEILNQLTDKGKAKIYIQPSNVPTALIAKYNIWADLIGGEQHLVVNPSRFEVLVARRA